MREGAVLNRFTAGQSVGRKVFRAQVTTNLAVAANLQVIRQVCAFTDEGNATIQPGRFQLVGCHIIAVTNQAVLADNDLLIQDRTVNYAASANDGVKEHDGVADNRVLRDDDTRREHAALDVSFDDTAMRDQALDDLCPAANMGGWTLLAAGVNHP